VQTLLYFNQLEGVAAGYVDGALDDGDSSEGPAELIDLGLLDF